MQKGLVQRVPKHQLTVIRYGPMKGKARFSGLPGGSVVVGVLESIQYAIYGENATVTNVV